MVARMGVFVSLVPKCEGPGAPDLHLIPGLKIKTWDTQLWYNFALPKS